jgi:hypothetical protein
LRFLINHEGFSYIPEDMFVWPLLELVMTDEGNLWWFGTITALAKLISTARRRFLLLQALHMGYYLDSIQNATADINS